MMSTVTSYPLRRRASPASQRGVALITVLMVFAIATLVATKVIVTKNIDTQRVSGMVNRSQAYYYALAGEQLAIMALKLDDEEDRKNNKGDTLDEPWAAPSYGYEIDPFSNLVIRIVDLNRFYNLNNLIQDDGQVNDQELARFKQLLEELDLDEELGDNLKDWLDDDDKETGYQSESDAYERREPAYLAANRPFADVSELRLINGFTDEVVRLLEPHLTVVPGWGVLPLNVNTATDYALTTLQKDKDNTQSGVEGIGLRGAGDIESSRPYEKLSDFTNAKVIAKLQGTTGINASSAKANKYLNSNLSHYTTSSDYYEINIRATYAGHVSYLTSVVKKASGATKNKYVVIERRETDNSQRFLR